MSEEFELREEPLVFEVKVSTNSNIGSYFADSDLRKAMDPLPGINVERKNKKSKTENLRIESWNKKLSETEKIRKRILKAINDSSLRKGGQQTRILDLEVQKIQEDKKERENSQKFKEKEVEDIWTKIMEASQRTRNETEANLTQVKNLGYQDLTEFYEEYRNLPAASEFILDESRFGWKDIWAALGRGIEETKTAIDGDDYEEEILEEIRKAEDDTEYESIWEEILLDYMEDEYQGTVEENLQECAELYEEIKSTKDQIENTISGIEGPMPIGYLDKGEVKELVIPIPDREYNPLEVLVNQIKDELNRYSTKNPSRSEDLVIMSLKADKNEIYESLNSVSQRLGIELDYGFLTRDKK